MAKPRETLPLLLGIVLACGYQLAGFAAVKDMKAHLPDSYLEREFGWSMVLNLPDTKHYLNYKGSTLHPLTQVCVNFQTHGAGTASGGSQTKLYEAFWYYKKSPVGMRRSNQISISPDSDGTIVVCPSDNHVDRQDRLAAIADTMVRLIVDVQVRGGITSLVMVPDLDYDGIGQALGHYGYRAEQDDSALEERPLTGPSIRLRAYPGGEEHVYLLQRAR